jgi:hypothetical protein
MNKFIKTTLAALAPIVVISGSLHAAQEKNNLEEIIIVYKSHFDIGYTR